MYKDWLDIVQTFVIILTLLVLIKYTYETYKLRRETEKQIKFITRPFVVINRSINGDNYVLKNVGNGVAFNVRIDDIVYQSRKDKSKIIFRIPQYKELIMPNSEIPIKDFLVIDPKSGESTNGQGMFDFNVLIGLSENNDLEIKILYNNVLGQEYVTSETLRNKNIELKIIEKKLKSRN